MSIQNIVVDFEMNPVMKANKDAKRRLKREIIEIGAVKIDEENNIIDTFRCYVKPQFNNEISPYITGLTGITYSNVCNAVTFSDAMSLFEAWVGYEFDSKVYSWSVTDLKQIQTECIFKNLNMPENMKNWFDLQNIYAQEMSLTNENKQMALHSAAEQFGILMDEKNSHSALYDAEITSELLISVLNDECKQQSELLYHVSEESSASGFCSLGESCDALLQLLCQMREETESEIDR